MEFDALHSDTTSATFAPARVQVRYGENKVRNYSLQDLADMASALEARIDGGTEDELAAFEIDRTTLAALTAEVTRVALADEIARREDEIDRIQAERDALAAQLV